MIDKFLNFSLISCHRKIELLLSCPQSHFVQLVMTNLSKESAHKHASEYHNFSQTSISKLLSFFMKLAYSYQFYFGHVLAVT